MTDFTNAAPPDDQSEGWKTDPTGASEFRWWDGGKWTERVGKGQSTASSAAPANTKNLWSQLKGWPTWAKIVVPIVGIVIVAAALTPDEESSDPEPATVTQEAAPESASTDETETTAEEQPSDPIEPEGTRSDDLKAAVDDVEGLVEDPTIKAFFHEGNTVVVIAETPEGGLEGPSTTDLGYMASGLFEALYGEGGFKGNTTIKFSGGLVDTSTGKDLPDMLTAEYEMKQAEARRIDWSDQDAIDYGIDWSLYRTFVHPAIKMDD
jgi:hypothetical protein